MRKTLINVEPVQKFPRSISRIAVRLLRGRGRQCEATEYVARSLAPPIRPKYRAEAQLGEQTCPIRTSQRSLQRNPVAAVTYHEFVVWLRFIEAFAVRIRDRHFLSEQPLI
jgi:hypothetical protein